MSRSSDEAATRERLRGQVEPIAALVALTVVGMGLGLYAGALGDVPPAQERDRARASLLFDRVYDDVVSVGVAHPDQLAVPDAAPADVGVGVVIVSTPDRWTVGSVDTGRPFPEEVDVATGSVSVRIAPGKTRSGELRVVVRS